MRPEKRLSTVVLLGLWIVSVPLAFWRFEWRYARPAARPTGAADAHPEMLPLSPVAMLETDRGTEPLNRSGQVTLLNFWNPDCACSRFAEPHTRQLAETFGQRGVRCITVIECGKTETEAEEARRVWQSRSVPGFAVALDRGGKIARAFGVWAAPAAVILNGQGRVAYVGSYNTARFCDSEKTAWARQALEALLRDQPPPHPRTAFFGCQVVPQEASQP